MPAASKVCPQCGTEYDVNQQFCPADGAALLSRAGEADFTGRIFGGRYRMIKRLGAGGMGNVYLAEHVRLKKLAAVKVIRSAMTQDAGAVARFNREAQNASMVNHPNVAAVYDFGEEEGNIVFLAMEFVDGEPLSDIIAAGPLEPARAASIVSQIADALTAAHRLGVVHRDLKPDNVMVARGPDGGDVVKLVDFGISKVDKVDDQNITATGMVIGTPTYMSPEQARGSRTLDSRSDIYSLGVLTFQVLTAALPFKGDTPQEQMVSRLVEAPATLSAVRPDLPWAPAVEQVLSKALAPQPEARYTTAQEFARALESALRATRRTAGLTPTVALGAISTEVASVSSARPKPVTQPANAAPVRKSGWRMTAGVAAAVVVVLGAGGFLVLGNRRPSPARDMGAAVAHDAAAAVQSVSAPPQRVGETPAPSQPLARNAAPTNEPTPAPEQTERRSNGQQIEPQGSAVTPAPVTPGPSAQPVDLNTAIQNLAAEVREPGAPAAQYRVAYAQSNVLLNHAKTRADSVRILFYRSRALGHLGDRSGACQSLSEAITTARGAPAARQLLRIAERMRCE